MTSSPAATATDSVAAASFIEKSPLEHYAAPAKPSLVGLSRVALAEALGAIDVPERQRAMRLTTSPRAITTMVDDYARSQSLVMLSRDDVRRFVGARPWMARAFAWRGPVMRRLRRFGNGK